MTIPESRTTPSAAVVTVLLADGWHRATLGSFTIGPLSLGDYTAPDTLGYRFEEADDTNPYGPAALAGPLEAVVAVRQVTPRDWRRRQRPPEPVRSRTSRPDNTAGLRTHAASPPRSPRALARHNTRT
jgi:hypothetical protein